MFFNIASKRDITHFAVWGPASAFAYNMARLGWSVNKQGILHTDSNLEFDLLRSDLRDIFNQIEALVA